MTHDAYRKELLKRVLGERFDPWAPERNLTFGGVEIRLDGVIRQSGDSKKVMCAVEIEARNEQQVRGAILNLALHDAPNSLLVLMAPNLGNSKQVAVEHFQAVWAKITRGLRGSLDIACLSRDGSSPAWKDDEKLLTRGLSRIGINSA